MTSKQIKYFTITMISVFIIATFYFIISLIAINSKVTKTSTSDFETITDAITDFANNYDLLTVDFVKQTESLLEKYPYLSGIVIKKDNQSFYAYPIDSPSIIADTNKEAMISVSAPSIKVFTNSKMLHNGESLIFNAAFNTILSSEIYMIGRRAFIAILATTLVAICLIIYLSMFGNNSNNTNDNSETEPIDESSCEFDTAKTDKSEPFTKSTPPEEKTILQDESSQDEKQTSSFQDTNNNPTEQTIETKQKETKIQKNVETIKEPKLSEKEDPMGLFSSISGFGWKQYLEPRLDSELIRAASSEQDVSLFMINIPNLNKTSEEADSIYKIILDFFKYRDMIFEYKDDCIAGIIVNMELETALDSAENLFIKLDWILKENSMQNKIGIGISTRTLRLVPGERLLNEAYQASIKALSEEILPIVAFKVNAEQYKQYITDKL